MKVSIISATFNSEKTILDTIRSIDAQDYEEIEHIVVDGNSSDKTIELVNSNQILDTKIVCESDKGIYDALNKGIMLSTGDIVGFLHSDDIFFDESCVTRLIQQFDRSGADAVYGDLQYVREDNLDRVVRHWKSRDYSLKCIEKGWMPPHPTFFVKRKIYKSLGLFDTSYKISGDYEIMIRFLYEKKIAASYLNYVITKMRVGGTSNNLANIIPKIIEDIRVMRTFKINPLFGILGKNFSKLSQFF